MSLELSQLQSLDAMLGTNEKVLLDTTREAEIEMDKVQKRERPNVDEVLVAPTAVGEQLYGLVAEEKAMGDAMFALTKALDKGRIGAEVYIKVSRVSARGSSDFGS